MSERTESGSGRLKARHEAGDSAADKLIVFVKEFNDRLAFDNIGFIDRYVKGEISIHVQMSFGVHIGCEYVANFSNLHQARKSDKHIDPREASEVGQGQACLLEMSGAVQTIEGIAAKIHAPGGAAGGSVRISVCEAMC